MSKWISDKPHIEIVGNTKRFTKEFREYLYLSSNKKCRYCGSEIKNANAMHIDHINPKANGGDDNVSNLGAACRFCNSSKGSKDIEFLRFNLALKERGINKIINQKQANELIRLGIDLGLELKKFFFEGEK